MIGTDTLDRVIGADVYDADGDKIGTASEVFLDDQSGDPEWITVKTGLFGTKETFVPIRDADLTDDGVRVPVSKAAVKDAPRIDSDGHLSPQEEEALYRHYGMGVGGGAGMTTGRTDTDTSAGMSSGTRDTDGRTGTAGMDASSGPDTDTSAGMSSGTRDTDGRTGTAGMDASSELGTDTSAGMSSGTRDTDGRTGTAGMDASSGLDTDGRTGTAGMGASAGRGTQAGTGTSAGTGTDTDRHGTVGHDTSGPTTDQAMTRSEEQLRVGTTTEEAGRARLRKYVVTENVTRTVPVTREEVRVDTDDARGDTRR